MPENRDLLDVDNLGEFAFAMCAIGLVFALISFFVAFFALELIGLHGHVYLGLLSVVVWILLNVPVYRALRLRARRWSGEQRATRQITYVELSSITILVGLSLIAGQTIGAHELIMVLEYLFSSWILALLVWQVFLHRALGYKIFVRDAVKWSIMFTYTLLNLYAKSV